MAHFCLSEFGIFSNSVWTYVCAHKKAYGFRNYEDLVVALPAKGSIAFLVWTAPLCDFTVRKPILIYGAGERAFEGLVFDSMCEI